MIKKLITAAFILAATAFGADAQSIVPMPLVQNPLFEVSTNNVTVSGAEGDITLGGDLVVKGGSGTYAYRWYDSEGKELGNNPTLTVSSPGKYNLDITDTCDCRQTVEFNVSNAAVGNLTADAVAISPNPTDGFVEISGFNPVQLTVVSMSGRMECLLDFGGEIISHADFSQLAPGHYFVTMTDAEGSVAVARLIKK